MRSFEPEIIFLSDLCWMRTSMILKVASIVGNSQESHELFSDKIFAQLTSSSANLQSTKLALFDCWALVRRTLTNSFCVSLSFRRSHLRISRPE